MQELAPGIPLQMMMGLGTGVNYQHPELYELNLDEIFLHLFNICRYNGAVKWDLARHSLLTASIAVDMFGRNDSDSEIMIAKALVHDFHETIVGDVVTGLKKLLPEYEQIESMWEDRVADCLGLPKNSELFSDDLQLIKHCDYCAFLTEINYLKHPAKDIHYLEPDLKDAIKQWVSYADWFDSWDNSTIEKKIRFCLKEGQEQYKEFIFTKNYINNTPMETRWE